MGVNRIRKATGRIVGPDGTEFDGFAAKSLRRKCKCKWCGSRKQEVWWVAKAVSKTHEELQLRWWCPACWLEENGATDG